MPSRREIKIDKLRRFREQAEKFRLRAAAMSDPLARSGLIQVAESYERMATFIESSLGDDLPAHSN